VPPSGRQTGGELWCNATFQEATNEATNVCG